MISISIFVTHSTKGCQSMNDVSQQGFEVCFESSMVKINSQTIYFFFTDSNSESDVVCCSSRSIYILFPVFQTHCQR